MYLDVLDDQVGGVASLLESSIQLDAVRATQVDLSRLLVGLQDSSRGSGGPLALLDAGKGGHVVRKREPLGATLDQGTDVLGNGQSTAFH